MIPLLRNVQRTKALENTAQLRDLIHLKLSIPGASQGSGRQSGSRYLIGIVGAFYVITQR